MRDAFDGVVDVMTRNVGPRPTASTSSLPHPPPRAVPKHPLSLLNGCSAANVKLIVQGIEDAIEIGAPLYNDGKLEACYRIYEGAALELQRKLSGCAGPKSALGVGLREAQKRKSYADKAWAMRDAFDGLLDTIERKFIN